MFTARHGRAIPCQGAGFSGGKGRHREHFSLAQSPVSANLTASAKPSTKPSIRHHGDPGEIRQATAARKGGFPIGSLRGVHKGGYLAIIGARGLGEIVRSENPLGALALPFGSSLIEAKCLSHVGRRKMRTWNALKSPSQTRTSAAMWPGNTSAAVWTGVL